MFFIGNGIDFNSAVQNITFEIGQTIQNIHIPIIYDSIIESNEEFNLVLKHVPGGDTNTAILEPSISVGIILDTCKTAIEYYAHYCFSVYFFP